jgi:pimeloyl-ACP methyl ester carboxylesterase
MKEYARVYLLGGLGGNSTSKAIIYDLAHQLALIDGVEVRPGLYSDFPRFADEANDLPPHIIPGIVGHSLGAAAACEMARRIGRPVGGICGFDIADNLTANVGRYGITPVPENVAFARSVFVPGGFLGGGGYYPQVEGQRTIIDNRPMPGASHVEITKSVTEHFLITETWTLIVARRRQAEA